MVNAEYYYEIKESRKANRKVFYVITDPDNSTEVEMGYDEVVECAEMGFKIKGVFKWKGRYVIMSLSEFRAFSILGGYELFILDTNDTIDTVIDKVEAMSNTRYRIVNFSSFKNFYELFYDSPMTGVDLSYCDMSNIVSCAKMFIKCKDLMQVNLEGVSMPECHTADRMFEGCSSLIDIKTVGFKTPKLSNVRCMFFGCRELESLNIDFMHDSKISDIQEIFSNCFKLKWVNLNALDGCKLHCVKKAFSKCVALENAGVSNWDVSHVKDFTGMFIDSGIRGLDLSRWNMQSANTLSLLFCRCKNLEKVNLSSWNLECKCVKGLDLIGMFQESSVTEVDMSGWVVSNNVGVDVAFMFTNCRLKEIDLRWLKISKTKRIKFIGIKNCKIIVSAKRFETLKQAAENCVIERG